MPFRDYADKVTSVFSTAFICSLSKIDTHLKSAWMLPEPHLHQKPLGLVPITAITDVITSLPCKRKHPAKTAIR